MTASQRWRRLWRLFEQAVDLHIDERAAFLDRACGSDSALLARLDALLAADQQTRSALDQPLLSPEMWQELRHEPPQAEVLELCSGMELGSYRIGERIGRGGMGSVYLAEHVDPSLARRAVVKVVRSDMDSAQIRRRLMAERSILAGLDHTNIARLFDSGAVQGGSPYFVQEFVDGEPLDIYCERHGLTLAQRLALFTKVCNAVHYAHQHLVVHRDLKPKNILVTAEGEPKLLDFGIAKLLDPTPTRAGQGGSETTATWHRFVTLNYASPEQIRGGRTSTVSDVYSLGVILYEMLTGRLPRRFKGRTLPEVARLFGEHDPPLASSVAGEARLKGDLDAIVAKALRSRPEERYQAARELVRDLELHRAGLPVSAREGTWRYLVERFVRRHRVAVTSAVLAALTVVGFTIGLASLAHRAAMERDAARSEREEKSQVIEMVQETFRLASPYKTRGQALTVRDALEFSVPVIEQRWADRPATRAQFQLVAGSMLADLGQAKLALEPLEEALAYFRRVDHRPGQVRSLTKLASVLKQRGQLAAAEALAVEAVALARQLSLDESGDRSALLLAGPLNEWVSVLCHRHEYDAALEPAQEALTLTAGLRGGEVRRISIYELLARIRGSDGDYLAAAELNRAALDLRYETHGPEHPSRVPALNNLGSNLRRLGELDGAAAAFSEAVDIERQSFGEDSGPHLPVLLANLGAVAFSRGDFPAAAERYADAGRVVSRTSGEGHWLIFALGLRQQRARAHLGELDSARAAVELLLATWRPKLQDHWRFAEGLGILGEILSLQGRCEPAEPLLVGSFETVLDHASHNDRKAAFERLADHFERCGRTHALEPYAVRYREQNSGSG